MCACCAASLIPVGGVRQGDFGCGYWSKSLFRDFITVLYDVSMKTLISLLLACCFGSAMAQSNLPACLGTDVTRWTACFGTERTAGYTYIGEFKDGKKNGTGTFTWPNGMMYVGEWRDDMSNGTGTFTWPDGGRYVGEFRDGKYHGTGTYTWPDGRRYVGEWRDGKQNGTGKLTRADGSVQDGQWGDGTFLPQRG